MRDIDKKLISGAIKVARQFKNLTAEPPYKNHDTVCMALSDPDQIIHIKNKECKIEYPHRWEECGMCKKAVNHDRQ